MIFKIENTDDMTEITTVTIMVKEVNLLNIDDDQGDYNESGHVY